VTGCRVYGIEYIPTKVYLAMKSTIRRLAVFQQLPFSWHTQHISQHSNKHKKPYIFSTSSVHNASALSNIGAAHRKQGKLRMQEKEEEEKEEEEEEEQALKTAIEALELVQYDIDSACHKLEEASHDLW
jgi:hypothetical protein